jgi:5S rRNA maturation endonuclease (ribonuclease M5)
MGAGVKAAQIKLENTVEGVLAARGIALVKGACKCPFHADKNPSFSVKDGHWKCWAGCGGGDVIDLLAKFEGKTAAQYLRYAGPAARVAPPPRPVSLPPRGEAAESEPDAPAGKIVEIYQYQDGNGKDVFQSVRLDPKDFRQRQSAANWSMKGVERVLYRLPKVRKAQVVWLTEGEKDVESLENCGFTATTSIGGAKGWLDSYADSLAGKDLILCGDNDDPGRKYMEEVEKSCAPVARTIRRVTVPAFCKDVSEYLASLTADEDATAILNGMAAQAEPLYEGDPLPLFTMDELEARYIEFLKRSKERALHLSAWMPSLPMVLVPGELLFILADTGVGKTAILGNLIISNPHLASVLFELELAESKIFQRMVQKAAVVSRYRIEAAYLTGGMIPWRESHKLDRLVVTPESFLTIERIDSIVRRSELKTGMPPALVFVDYVQLVNSTERDRRSRVADISEGLKKMAKARNVVVICTSQIARDNERGYGDVGLHDGKEAGEIENSAGTVLGVSRNPDRPQEMCIQVLKSTEHGGGKKVYADFDFETLRIAEKLLQ